MDLCTTRSDYHQETDVSHSDAKSLALHTMFSNVTAPSVRAAASAHQDVDDILQSNDLDFMFDFADGTNHQRVDLSDLPLTDFSCDPIPEHLEIQCDSVPISDSLMKDISEGIAVDYPETQSDPASNSYYYAADLGNSVSTGVSEPSTLPDSSCPSRRNLMSIQSGAVADAPKEFGSTAPGCMTLPPSVASTTGWTSFEIPKTVVHKPLRAEMETCSLQSSASVAENTATSIESRPKLRYSKGAAASKYCHICGRNSKTVVVVQCANVEVGLCRKVVCEKCLIIHQDEMGGLPLQTDSNWKCSHCEGVCPKRARCHQYMKNNMRRRMKSDFDRRGEDMDDVNNFQEQKALYVEGTLDDI